jgi:hypothetical protein
MVKTKRVFSIIFIVLTIFLLSACSKKSTPPPPPLPQWTILGYFDGNNYLDTSGTAGSHVIKDVQEMEKVGSTEDVQIIVMLGSIKTQGNCNYYLIEKCVDDDTTDSISSKVLDSLGQPDMSDPQTLRDFVKYGVEHYPAQHYMLIINDHGDGWKGVCSDEENGDGEWMSLPELSSALFGYKFDIIISNVPSMSMLEVAYQLKGEANYLIASEYEYRERWLNEFGFSIWLKDLTGDPSINVRGLTSKIVTAIYAIAGTGNVNVCATDNSKIVALTSEVAEFGNLLVTHTGDHWKEVVDAWVISTYYGPYYFDLKNFTQNIQTSIDLDSTIKNAAQAVENAINVAVVKTLSNPDLGNGGLCIHFPVNSGDFDSINYVQLGFAISNWDIFLSRFIQAYVQANTGSLRVVSEPVKGAWIFLDGDSTGFVTDTTIHGIPAGQHKVRLVKAGYDDSERHGIMVFAGQIREVIIPFGPPSSPKESISELQ